jgi:hypothetical protein
LGIGDWAQSPIPNPQSPKTFLNITTTLCLNPVINKYLC